jgi:hypothetical protein
MTRIWELPSGHQPKDDRRHGERRSPWPTVIYTKSERRKHPDRRKNTALNRIDLRSSQKRHSGLLACSWLPLQPYSIF